MTPSSERLAPNSLSLKVVEFSGEEEVKHCPYADDGGEFSDVAPCGGDCGPQDIGPNEEFEAQGEGVGEVVSCGGVGIVVGFYEAGAFKIDE